MTSSSMWLPVDPDDEKRVITSASLDEGMGASDRVKLFVQGVAVTGFDVPAGLGAKLLAECGMRKRVP